MIRTKHLIALCVSAGLILMLVACGPSTPQEKVVDSFKAACERVDKAKSQKSLNTTSQILIGDINKAIKGLDPVQQNQVMTSLEVTRAESEYNVKIQRKRKELK